MKKLLAKRWFYPLALTYLLFGIWFGSLNHGVVTHPENYSYNTRLFLYPLSTVLIEGWGLCSDGGKCILRAHPDVKLEKSIILISAFKEIEGSDQWVKFHYIATLAIFWPIKVVLNIVSMGLLCLFNVVMVMAVIMLFFYGILVHILSIAIVWIFDGIFNLLL